MSEKTIFSAFQLAGLHHRRHGPRKQRRSTGRHLRPTGRGTLGRQAGKLWRLHGRRDGAKRGCQPRAPAHTARRHAGEKLKAQLVLFILVFLEN
jgi:hypothetical protein